MVMHGLANFKKKNQNFKQARVLSRRKITQWKDIIKEFI